jgi:hypothetical protein
MAPVTGSNDCEWEAAGDGVALAPKLHQAALERGLIGLAAASTAITMAVCEPPPGLNKTTYLLTLSGVFFAGVTQVSASVCGHGAGMTKLIVLYTSLVVAAASLLQ